MKLMRLIFVAVLELAAGISFFTPRGFSQTAPPLYLQTAFVDGGLLTSGPSNFVPPSVVGPPTFVLNGQFTTAQTTIEMLPTAVGGVQTLNGTAMSQVMTTGQTSSTAYASSKAEYLVQVDSSVSQSVPLEIVGTLLGSLGTAQGEAFALVGFDEAALAQFDITTGTANTPLDTIVTVPTNIPQVIELDTFASLSGGLGTISAQIDPYVLIAPSVPNPQQYQLTFAVSPVPEPTSWTMLVGGLGFLLAVGGCRKFLGSREHRMHRPAGSR